MSERIEAARLKKACSAFFRQLDKKSRGDVGYYSDAIAAALAAADRPATVMGFASFKDGSFELIVRDKNTFEETTLHGQLKPGQFETIDRILPTCVFVPVAAADRVEGEDCAELIAQLRKEAARGNPNAELECCHAPWTCCAPELLTRAAAALSRLPAAAKEDGQISELLRVIDERDCEHNLFNCPSGGWIRQQLKAALSKAIPAVGDEEEK